MFSLHPQLEKDTFPVAELTLSRLLLMNNKNFPWLILVPRKQNLKEIIDLRTDDRTILMEEICLASEQLRALFKPDKINVASLGNLVPQLHIHVIARYLTDSAWPAPVWGTPCEPYDEVVRDAILAKLKIRLRF